MRAIRPVSRRRSRSLHSATIGLWASSGRMLHRIGVGVGMASLRARGCAAGIDQSDEGAQASRREAQDRHDRLLDTGSFGPRQRHHLPVAILSFNDQIRTGVASQPPYDPYNPPQPRMMRCGYPDPLDLSGIARRNVLADVSVFMSGPRSW